jgi:hypothetical protein
MKSRKRIKEPQCESIKNIAMMFGDAPTMTQNKRNKKKKKKNQ